MAGGLLLPGLQPLQPGQTYDNAGRVINNPNPSIFDIYGSAVGQQGKDYGDVMSGYDKQASSPPIAPISYSSSPDVTNALSSLSDFTKTGGYSPTDIAALRERAISPIRSIYASAQNNLNRNKVLQGGYSPGYAGATAKMARDLSSQIGDTSTNVNAQLAQNIVGNKLSALSPYANLASSEAGRNLDVNKFNVGTQQAEQQRQLDILRGKTGLYGTSPAAASTYGSQALGFANLNQQNQMFNTDLRNKNQLALISASMRGFGG